MFVSRRGQVLVFSKTEWGCGRGAVCLLALRDTRKQAGHGVHDFFEEQSEKAFFLALPGHVVLFV